MPRDGSGTYTLPAGVNPVVAGTVIDVLWANPTLGDVATALTDSLSRTGSGGMLAPFLNSDGAIGAPGISWVNEPTMGIYRPNANEMRFVTAGVDQVRTVVDANNPLQVWVNSDTSWRTVLNLFNPYTILGAWTFQGLVTHTGALITDDSTTARAGLNVPLGVAPTSPVDGDVWTTAVNMFARINGLTVGLGGSNIVPASTGASTVLRGDGAGGWVEEIDATISATGVASFDGGMSTDGAMGIGDGVDNMSSVVTGGVVQTAGTGGLAGWRWLTDLFIDRDFKMLEANVSAFDSAGYQQIWAEATVPTRLMTTSDDGDDAVIALSGGVIGYNVNVNNSFNFNTANNLADNFISHHFDGGNDTITLADVSELDNWPLYTTINIIAPGSGNITITEGSGTTLFLSNGADSVGGVVVSQGVVSITRQSSTAYIIWGSGIT